MYHSISSDKSRWAVPERSFREQIRLLASEGWTTLCVRDLVDNKPLPKRAVVVTFDDGYSDNFNGAFLPLAASGMKATLFMVSGAVGKGSHWDAGPAMRMLERAQLIEMEGAGIEIGSHTRTHPRLTEARDLNGEIAGSKEDIEEITGKPVVSFAYPYGLLDDKSVNAVKAAGYAAACTTRTGWYGSERDPLRIRRVAVFPEDSLSSFARKLVFADNEVSWARMTRYMASRVRARLGFAG
jgi:peptidoglycan/xylan/chitin deacetylase (PgdA/CDA1 family)